MGEYQVVNYVTPDWPMFIDPYLNALILLPPPPREKIPQPCGSPS
jgi:hypothetical protein